MSLAPTALDSLLRSNQILADADALLGCSAGGGGTSTATSALGALGALDLTDIGSGPGNDVVGTANQAAHDLFGAFAPFANSNGLGGSAVGLGALGDAIGLGHAGQGGNLASSLLGLPAAGTSGNTGAVGGIIPEVLGLSNPGIGLLSDVTAYDAGVNDGWLSVLGQPFNVLHAATPIYLEQLVDDVVNTVTTPLEHALDNAGLPNTAHAVEGVEQALFGSNNLVADVLAAPGQLLAGNTSILSELPTDVGNVVGSVQGVVSGVLADLAHGGALSNPLGVVTGLVNDVTSTNVPGLLNEVINEFHSTIEVALDSPIGNTVHGLTSLGNAVGLGTIGQPNLLTDVLATPGALASGNLAPIEHLPADLGTIAGAVGNFANGIGQDLASNAILGTLEHPTSGYGILGGNLPGQGVLGEVTSIVNGAAPGGTGLGGLTGALGGLTGGGGHGPLDTVTSTLGGLTGGGGHGPLDTVTSTLGGLTGGTGHGPLDTVTSTLGGLTGGGQGPLDTVTSTLGGLTGGGGHGPLDMVTSTLGGLTGGGGHGPLDTVTSTLGGLTGGGGHGPLDGVTSILGGLTGGSLQFPPSSNGGDSLSGMGGSMSSPPAHGSSGSTTPPASNSAPPMESEPASHHHAEHAGGAPHADWFGPSAHAGHG